MKSNRLIFGDESGDAGMNIEKGSSRYFTISFVIFDDFLEAEKASLEIKKLRRLRFKNDTQEFHFTKDSMATRKDFFEAISDFDFKIKAYVVDKMSLDKDIFKDNEKFYEFFLVKAFEAFAKDFDQAKVHFDGKSSRVYKKKIKTNINNVLKKKGVKIDDIKFLDSKSDQLIQLADMCAGLIKKNLDLSNIALCAMYNKLKKKIEIKRFE